MKSTNLASALALIVVSLGNSGDNRADQVQCTVTLEACGGLEQSLSPLAKIKEGACMKADLATIGKNPEGLRYSAVVWIGVAVSGDTLVFGKGEAKAGVALECTWNVESPKPQVQLASLKASIPEILEKSQDLKKQFPGVKKIDVSKLSVIQTADRSCSAALAEFVKK